MIAHFYLMAESFAKNAELANEIIEERVKQLSQDAILIYKHKETNKLYTSYTDLYPQVFYQTYTVQDFVCTPQELKEQGVDRDIINSLQKILDKSSATTISSKEVINELLNWNDTDNCHGIIAFHQIPDLEESLQIVYGLNDWYEFRRHYLSLYPKNEAFFIDECVNYFPSLFFHTRNKTTVGAILKSSAKKIIHHLSELNDKYNTCRTSPYSRVETLKRFNSTCHFDQDASVEGDINRKSKLSWEFTTSSGLQEKIYCELHLKLLLDDSGKVSTDRRIYFHEGRPTIANGKILIGHIGDHL